MNHRVFASAAILLLLISRCPAAEPPEPAKTDLFLRDTAGYAIYRIPGIIVSTKGTLLAYCEARRPPGGDWSHLDVMLRRSADGGKTWDGPTLIAGESKATTNNPVMIPDAKTGAIHFLHCVDYARCFYSRSDNDGKTFSKEVEITGAFEAFHKEYAWTVIATGPGHGIQLKSGRLVVPVWLALKHEHHPSVTASIYSDDHGATWQAGQIIPGKEKIPDMNETTAVQLEDGRVMFNIRSPAKEARRAVSISPDGASGWTMPAFDEALYEPVCFASIVGFHDASAQFHILFSNPDSRADVQPGKRGQRKNLTIRLSDDQAKTWRAARVLDPGPSGYSDLAVGPDGSIYCLYERGAKSAALTVAKFQLEWVGGKGRVKNEE
jgi:sialidase-1